MAHILFIDPKAPHNYHLDSIEQEALGGTEATLIRVIKKLAEWHTITLAHSLRCNSEKYSDNIVLASIEYAKCLPHPPDHIVIIKKVDLVPELVKRYPSAKIHFYFHTISITKRLRHRFGHLYRFNANIICVSNSQAVLVDKALNQGVANKLMQAIKMKEKIPVNVIYNPINDDLAPDSSARDINKLLFVSSPSKGLDQVISRFFRIKKQLPDLKLYIANPGYMSIDDYLTEDQRNAQGVVILGAIPHEQVIQHMRTALCVLYPQNKFFETFGIVYAEANAVGTPVIALDFGAAKEVLSDENQILPDDDDAILARIKDYQEAKKKPQPVRDKFRLSSVIKGWQTYLTEAKVLT